MDYERRRLRDAASECPTLEKTTAGFHAVILNPDGEVVTAR